MPPSSPARPRRAIVDEAPGIYHEQHAASWGGGLYAAYNGYLAALDAPHLTRWAIYHAALEHARATGAPSIAIA